MKNESIEIDYIKEKNKLKKLLPKTFQILEKYNCYIAGGAITSLFTGREIKDVDIYFKSKNELFDFLATELENEYIVYVTKKAITYKLSNMETAQFVFMNYYEKASDIFNDFDFTINMGAFDIQKDKFILHNDFMKDNVNRKLVFNTKTSFPIVSGTRVRKYLMKGYEIDSLELTKILLTINNLKINNYDDLEKHLGGMYGENILEFTKEEKNKEFNMLNVLEKLEHYYDEEHEFIRENKEMEDLLNIEDGMIRFQKLLNYKIPYFKYKNKLYSVINKNDYIMLDEEEILNNPELFIEDLEQEKGLYKTLKLYKYVHKIDDKYYSFYDPSYEYKVGQEQVPNSKYLYVCKKKGLENATYKDEEDKALLICEVDLDDIKNINTSTLECTRLKVIDIKDLKNKEINFEELF